MCTVNIKVDDALVRRINPGLSSRESPLTVIRMIKPS